MNESKIKEAIINASQVFDTYGIRNRNFSANFRAWIALTKTTFAEYRRMIKKAYISIHNNEMEIEVKKDDEYYFFYVDLDDFKDTLSPYTVAAYNYSDYFNGHDHEEIVTVDAQIHDKELQIQFLIEHIEKVQVEDEQIKGLLKEI